MPGCLFLGARLFAECCALEQVGVLTELSCQLVRGATISPYAFEGCAKLKQIGLPWIKASTGMQGITSPPEGLPTGCFHSAGIQTINLPQSTIFIMHKAFAQCQQLTTVDLSHTQVRIVQVQVFSHRRSLAQISLPKHLTEIDAEAFEACVLLCTVALPEHFHSIGHRAFAECSKLVCLTHRSTKAGQHCIQEAANAFEGCQSRYGEMLRRLNTPQQTPRQTSRTQILLQVNQENDRPGTHNQCRWEASNCQKQKQKKQPRKKTQSRNPPMLLRKGLDGLSSVTLG